MAERKGFNRPIRRVAITGSAVLLGTALTFGVDFGPLTISAQGESGTPTSTATRTPTLDVLAIQIRYARQTMTALEARLQKERELANTRATNTALLREIEAVRATVTLTPTLTSSVTPGPTFDAPGATATADAKRLAAIGKEQAGIIATATARAVLSATPAPSATSAAVLERVSKEKEERGFPWGIAAVGGGVVATLGAAGVVLWRRFHH